MIQRTILRSNLIKKHSRRKVAIRKIKQLVGNIWNINVNFSKNNINTVNVKITKIAKVIVCSYVSKLMEDW